MSLDENYKVFECSDGSVAACIKFNGRRYALQVNKFPLVNDFVAKAKRYLRMGAEETWRMCEEREKTGSWQEVKHPAPERDVELFVEYAEGAVVCFANQPDCPPRNWHLVVEPAPESHAALIARLAPGYEEVATKEEADDGAALASFDAKKTWAFDIGYDGGAPGYHYIWLRRIQSVPTSGPLPAGRYKTSRTDGRSRILHVNSVGLLRWDHIAEFHPINLVGISWSELHNHFGPFTRLADEPEKAVENNPHELSEAVAACTKRHEPNTLCAYCPWIDVGIPGAPIPGRILGSPTPEPAKAVEAKACWRCLGIPVGPFEGLCAEHVSKVRAQSAKAGRDLCDTKEQVSGGSFSNRPALTEQAIEVAMATENDEYARRQAKHIEQIRREMAQSSSGLLTGYKAMACEGK